jgi:hypothetical protein
MTKAKVIPQWYRLPSHVSSKARPAGFVVEFTADGLELRLGTAQKTACVRVAREVLSNMMCQGGVSLAGEPVR